MRLRLKNKYQQDGLASMVVVFVLIIILSIISLAFARLMDRAVSRASSDNLAAAADYAARSGVNQAAAFIKSQLQQGSTIPTQAATDCNYILNIAPPNGLKGLNNLSGDSNVEYTCVLIDTSSVNSLLYKQIPAYQSQVIKLNPTTHINKLMVSWQSSDPTKNRNLPSGTPTLLNETDWGKGGGDGNGFEPMLRVTLYPINPAASIGTPTTFFLYPSSGSGSSVTTVPYGAPDGSFVSVDCTATDTGGQFNGSTQSLGANTCNAIFSLSPPLFLSGTPPDYYYIRLTPLYAMADVEIQGNDVKQNTINFPGTQYLVDVTAKANNAVKRLQARVDAGSVGNNISPTDNAFPEYALRSADTICKRLLVQGGVGITLDPGTNSAYCNLSPPPATFFTVLKVSRGGTGGGNVKSSDGFINCGSTCTHNYDSGTQVTLTATPNSTSVFAGWTGACTGQTSTCQLTLIGTVTTKAIFNHM